MKPLDQRYREAEGLGSLVNYHEHKPEGKPSIQQARAFMQRLGTRVMKIANPVKKP